MLFLSIFVILKSKCFLSKYIITFMIKCTIVFSLVRVTETWHKIIWRKILEVIYKCINLQKEGNVWYNLHIWLMQISLNAGGERRWTPVSSDWSTGSDFYSQTSLNLPDGPALNSPSCSWRCPAGRTGVCADQEPYAGAPSRSRCGPRAPDTHPSTSSSTSAGSARTAAPDWTQRQWDWTQTRLHSATCCTDSEECIYYCRG